MATETISVTTEHLPNMWVASFVLAKLCLGPTCSVSVPLKLLDVSWGLCVMVIIILVFLFVFAYTGLIIKEGSNPLFAIPVDILSALEVIVLNLKLWMS